MKATIKLPKVEVEVEGANQKQLFAEIASAVEVFGEKSCSLCSSEDIKPVVREVPDGKQVFTYYEYVCNQCSAKLQLGQSTDTTTLFPKRKLDSKNRPDDGKNSADCKYGKHKGWSKEWLNHVKKEG
jgi:hypothetical protein